MSKAALWFPIGIAACIAVLLCLGALYFDYSLLVLQFPLLVGTFTCLLCGVQALRVSSGQLEAAAPASEVRGQPVTRVAARALWLSSIVPAVFLLGYPLGLSVYLFLFLKLRGQSWWLASVCALSSLGVVEALFMTLLNVPLPAYPIGWT